uniref:thioredoxin-like domain-containing protein n=1 Tax=Flavobacterium sp. TaxID=239 RepID=UPI00404A58F8
MMQLCNKKYIFFYVFLGLVFTGCEKEFTDENFTAYFGGEIINPSTDYVLFLKNNEVIDTLFLDENRRFFKKFDSLAPGMYTFKHEPEYQYIYFDKNDSIMVRINSLEFDESIVFCGRGDEKNNFLIDLYLKNQADRKNSFDDYDLPVDVFLAKLDSTQQQILSYYDAKKTELGWCDRFDSYVKTNIDLGSFTKKEIYPMIHNLRTGNESSVDFPADYYAHRKNIDFEHADLMHYSPMVRYLSHMLSNISYQEVIKKNIPEIDKSLEMGLIKLHIADTLFKDATVKNRVLDQITFNFLLEDQNIHNTEKMLLLYNQLSTNNSKKSEIKKIEDAIQKLTKNELLPTIKLVRHDSTFVESNLALNKKSVIIFWTENAETHLAAIHRKANIFSQSHPAYQFVFINIDTSHDDWRDHLAKYKNEKYHYYKAVDFEKLKSEWVITKLHRTIILDEKGRIDNAFVNLFDARFNDFLH